MNSELTIEKVLLNEVLEIINLESIEGITPSLKSRLNDYKANQATDLMDLNNPHDLFIELISRLIEGDYSMKLTYNEELLTNQDRVFYALDLLADELKEQRINSKFYEDHFEKDVDLIIYTDPELKIIKCNKGGFDQNFNPSKYLGSSIKSILNNYLPESNRRQKKFAINEEVTINLSGVSHKVLLTSAPVYGQFKKQERIMFRFSLMDDSVYQMTTSEDIDGLMSSNHEKTIVHNVLGDFFEHLESINMDDTTRFMIASWINELQFKMLTHVRYTSELIQLVSRLCEDISKRNIASGRKAIEIEQGLMGMIFTFLTYKASMIGDPGKNNLFKPNN
ncbi:MAG: hypothetical protein ACTSYA_10355 [Candidatus Kariarchaeaceae archaeon]